MTTAAPRERDGTEAFVAELTLAAYGVALRAETRGTWVDLQLGLWRALTDKVKAWERDGRLCPAVPKLPGTPAPLPLPLALRHRT